MVIQNFFKRFAPYLIFIAAMLWATDAPFRIQLTKDLSSNFIVLGEHFFDILIAIPILFINRSELKKLTAKGWISIILVALCGSALASIAFTEAFHYVNPSVAILLQKLQPFIAIGLAMLLLQERLPKRFWLWTFLAVFAAYVISFPNLIPQVYDGEVFNPNFIGVSLALIAAIFWGGSTVLGKYALATISFKTMASLRFILAFIFLLLLNAYQGTLGVISTVTSRDWFFIFIIAFSSGIASLFIYYKGLENTKASVATVAELGFPLAAVIVNAIFISAPITAVQILWINIISDGFPHLSLTVDPKAIDIMKRPPISPNANIISKWMRELIVIVSLTGGVIALLLFLYYLHGTGDLQLARSIAFATLGVNSLVYVFSIRTLKEPFWRENPFSNKWLNLAVLVGLFFQILPFMTRGLRNFFDIKPLGVYDWLTVFAASFVMFIIIEVTKVFVKKENSPLCAWRYW